MKDIKSEALCYLKNDSDVGEKILIDASDDDFGLMLNCAVSDDLSVRLESVRQARHG